LGIGNPLYSIGKRVVRGVAAIPEMIRAIPGRIDEARGIYDANTTGKYGNLADGTQRQNYNQTTLADIGNYTLLATGGVSSATAATTKTVHLLSQQGVMGLFSDTTIPLTSDVGQALSKMGAVSGAFGAAASLVDVARGFRQWQDTGRRTSDQ